MNKWEDDSWFLKALPEIQAVQKILEDRLSDNPTELYGQLCTVEAWHGRMTSLLADANARLDGAEYQALIALPEGVKGSARDITVANIVKKERRLRDILDGLCTTIKNRLILGESLRRQSNAERGNFTQQGTDFNG